MLLLPPDLSIQIDSFDEFSCVCVCDGITLNYVLRVWYFKKNVEFT